MKKRKNILVTGGAGFIGSNLVGTLLMDERVNKVFVIDNLASGSLENLVEFDSNPNFEFIEADIRDYSTCEKVCRNVDLISHQAALGSVPRSINDPLTTNSVNISGSLNIFQIAAQSEIERVVFAASSSTYGDSKELPKVEENIGNPLSPYAVTKYVNELYAAVYSKYYNFNYVGLRYFNVYGPKQDPSGAYAAVIPLFVRSILNNTPPMINGDGEQSRDFTYVDNAVQANIKALFVDDDRAINEIYNIACQERITINRLFNDLTEIAQSSLKPTYGPERRGDVRDSLADISKASMLLNYNPGTRVTEGLRKTFKWYVGQKID